ncbi:unnamed protein product, partial [Citrullus colocynthis]
MSRNLTRTVGCWLTKLVGRKCGLGGLLDSLGVDPSTIKGKSALFDLKRRSVSSSLVSLLRNEDLGREEE